MQRGKDQMAGLGGGERRLDGVQIPHLADEDHVRVFPEDGPETVGIGAGVRADLPLVDDAAVGGVDVLDGVLQGDDVAGAGVVDAVQQRGQGGGFARARLAGDEDDAAAVGGEIGHHRGQGQLLQRGDMVGQQTDGGGDAALLAEQVDTGAGDAGEGTGQVQLTDGGHGLVNVTGQLAGIQLAVLRGKDLIGQVGDSAVDAALGRQAADQMDVGGVQAVSLFQKLVQGEHGADLLSRWWNGWRGRPRRRWSRRPAPAGGSCPAWR